MTLKGVYRPCTMLGICCEMAYGPILGFIWSLRLALLLFCSFSVPVLFLELRRAQYECMQVESEEGQP